MADLRNQLITCMILAKMAEEKGISLGEMAAALVGMGVHLADDAAVHVKKTARRKLTFPFQYPPGPGPNANPKGYDTDKDPIKGSKTQKRKENNKGKGRDRAARKLAIRISAYERLEGICKANSWNFDSFKRPGSLKQSR